MIQRIQTIWLLLATATLILMLFLPIATKELTGSEISVYTKGLIESHSLKQETEAYTPFYPLFMTNIALVLICFINIFNFKKRNLQKRIVVVSILLIGGFAFWCSVYAKKIPNGIEGANFGIGAYLPALAILFCVLAIFGINKDERLIRSAERLR